MQLQGGVVLYENERHVVLMSGFYVFSLSLFAFIL
jgi:hypothetical protein